MWTFVILNVQMCCLTFNLRGSHSTGTLVRLQPHQEPAAKPFLQAVKVTGLFSTWLRATVAVRAHAVWTRSPVCTEAAISDNPTIQYGTIQLYPDAEATIQHLSQNTMSFMEFWFSPVLFYGSKTESTRSCKVKHLHFSSLLLQICTSPH